MRWSRLRRDGGATSEVHFQARLFDEVPQQRRGHGDAVFALCGLAGFHDPQAVLTTTAICVASRSTKVCAGIAFFIRVSIFSFANMLYDAKDHISGRVPSEVLGRGDEDVCEWPEFAPTAAGAGTAPEPLPRKLLYLTDGLRLLLQMDNTSKRRIINAGVKVPSARFKVAHKVAAP